MKLGKSLLVETIGWPMPLLHGDTGTLDRWLWLDKHLPQSDGSLRLLDLGCGSGAFTIGAARKGYRALGLSFDTRNQGVAEERARQCGATLTTFDQHDLRNLHTRTDLVDQFDVVVMCEVIEHVLNDEKLLRDAARCVKPGGRLLLTTPNFDAKAIDPSHDGPFPTVEDGGHVRKGYRENDLERLARAAGLSPNEFSYCTGLISQNLCKVFFRLARIHPVIAWSAVNPLRVLPPLLDDTIARATRWPGYSICMEAGRPLHTPA